MRADIEVLLNRLRLVLKQSIVQRNRLTEMLGVSPSTMGRWLNGEVIPRGLSVHQLRRVLDELPAPVAESKKEKSNGEER